MKKSALFTIGILLTGFSQAGVYTQDFQAWISNPGATDLGDGSILTGPHAAVVEQIGYFTSLRLTQDSQSTQLANYVLPDLDPGESITGFNVSFDSLIKNSGGLADSADGYSLNFGTLPTSLPDGGEQGMTSSSLLSIGWDTLNTDGGRGIFVRVNGAIVASTSASYANVSTLLTGPFINTTIVLDENGLDVSYWGGAIFTDLDVSAFTPSAGDKFAFAARTGWSDQDVIIDNVVVTTTAIPEPTVMSLLALSGVGAFALRRILSI